MILAGQFDHRDKDEIERNGESLSRKASKVTVIGGETGISVILDSLRKGARVVSLPL